MHLFAAYAGRYKSPRVTGVSEAARIYVRAISEGMKVAAFIKAHPVSAAEEIGTAARGIAQRISVAGRSEAAPSSVTAIVSARMRASVEFAGQCQTTASYNKRLVPTRKSDALLLAAQPQR